MFQPGRKLLGLTELVVDVSGPEKDAWGPTWADDFQEMLLRGRDMNGLESTACIRARDVLRIAACCPNLKRLTLNGVLEVEYENAVSSSFRAMQGLQQLTHLCLGGPWLTNNTAAVVAGMTNLRSLQLHNAPVLMANGLERLTALQQLRSLQLKHIGPHCEGNFCFEADTEAQEPDVWRQLAGKLQSMRQWQLNFDQKWEGYDAEVTIEEWSDLPEGSDMLTGSDGSDTDSDS